MRREMLVAVACGAALLVPAGGIRAQAGSPCANGNKVALVNSQRVMASIPAYLQAESLFTKEMDGYKADITKQRAALDSASNAYAENSTLLNTAAKNAAMKKLQDQNDALQKHMADLQAKADQRQAELVGPTMNPGTGGTGRCAGCARLLDCLGRWSKRAERNCIGGQTSLDIRERVIELLKSSAPAPAKPAAPGGIRPPGGGGGGGGGELPAAALPARP